MLKKKEEDPNYSIQLPGANTILINSIRDLKLKTGVNTALSQHSFLELGRLMNRERIQQEKELEAVRKLEDLI